MSETTKKSLGQEIIEGLSELRDTVRSGERISKKFTVRTVELDLEQLNPNQHDAESVREIRDALGVSQAVFAKMLAVSKSTIESWEQGTREVSDMACRLLDLVNTNRDKWMDMLNRSVEEKTVSA